MLWGTSAPSLLRSKTGRRSPRERPSLFTGFLRNSFEGGRRVWMNTGDFENLFYQSVNVGLHSGVREEAKEAQLFSSLQTRDWKWNKKRMNEFTVRRWCSGRWAPSSASPSRCAGRPPWSETSAAPVSAAGSPARAQASGTPPLRSAQTHTVDCLTTVSSLIFLFSAGLSSFPVMLLYFSSIWGTQKWVSIEIDGWIDDW